MKNRRCFQSCGRILGLVPTASSLSTMTVMLALGFAGVAHPATNTVTSLADGGVGSLRQAMADSAAGDSIVFGVTGTITLTKGELVVDKDLTIIGPGRSALAISGNRLSRVFNIQSNVTVLISDLTIRDGRARDGTNGIPIGSYGTPGSPGEPGGAIITQGYLTLWNCVVTASAAGNGGNGVSFPSPPPAGTPSAGGAGGAGGAIHNSGTLSLSNCVISGNATGNGGQSGSTTYSPRSSPGGDGGGIYSSGTLLLDGSIVSSNSTGYGASTPIGEAGASGGSGGGIWNGGSLSANRCVFSGNTTGSGGWGGLGKPYGGGGGSGGFGGGICSRNAMALTNCTVGNNICGGGGGGGYSLSANGGSGGLGGLGGGIYASNGLVLIGCTISGNQAGFGGGGGGSQMYGGSGGRGGDGGGIWNAGRLTITNCTLSGNFCGGGGVGSGGGFYTGAGGGGGSGGGIYLGGTDQAVVASTIVANAAGLGGMGGSTPGPNGWGGGVAEHGDFLNCIIALNTGQPPDVSGVFNSLGHNLVGVTNGSSGFIALGDLAGSSASPIDPKVASLADNRGPTLTMALLPGSPAIDAGDTAAAPPTDQRGHPRPIGLAADIGAYEYGSTPRLHINPPQAGGIQILLYDVSGPCCRLLTSTNLTDWLPMATNQIGADGTTLLQINVGTAERQRFYRVALP